MLKFIEIGKVLLTRAKAYPFLHVLVFMLKFIRDWLGVAHQS